VNTGGEAPFSGLRVLDLAWVVAGPMVGRSLADFGATVVRVESSQRLDTARLMGPFPDGVRDFQKSGLFDNCNAGKLGLTLDLANPEGQAVVRDLVRWSDVVIESFSRGQMERWGLGYAELRGLKPDIILLSTSLMGDSGPWREISGYGNIGAALSGFQAVVGWPDSLPCGPYGPYTDFIAPRFSLVALLAALDHRERTGDGCLIDVSQAEAGIQFLAPQVADCALSGREAAHLGNRDHWMAPHGVFPCEPEAPDTEGWIALAVRSDAEWQFLAGLIGGAALARDERFATLTARKQNEEELERIVAGWTQTQSARTVETRLQAHGIPAHNVASSADMVNDPQLQQRGHFVRQVQDSGEETTIESARYRLSETPAQLDRPAPYFGRDRDIVLRELLGYDEERIAALDARGVLR